MSDSEKIETPTLYPFIFWILIIIIIWLAAILVVNFLYGGLRNEEVAWFGDSFGAINSLFSGLAFAGIIYTILLQRNELRLQRQELKETRDELRRSADAQEKSEAAFNKQIELMNVTARLNGLSSSLTYHIYEAKRIGGDGRAQISHRTLAKINREQIDDILMALDDFGKNKNHQ